MSPKFSMRKWKPVAFIFVPLCLFAWWFLSLGVGWSFVNEAERGHTTEVRRYLDEGVSPNRVSLIGGISALRMAIIGGHADTVRLLLDRGANPTDGLRQAIQQGGPEMVELLIAKGADVNAKPGDHNSPLQLAKGYGDKRIVQALQAKGAVK